MSAAGRRRTSRRRTEAPISAWIIRDYQQLRAYAGVRSVAIGVKETASRPTRRLCVKIYVEQKQSEDELGASALPKTAVVLRPAGKGLYRAHRLPTDVVQTPAYRLAGAGDAFQNIPSGAKIGRGGVDVAGFGTQMAVVRNRSNGRRALMTAGHVLWPGTGPIGEGKTVFQPNTAIPRFLVGPTLGGFIGNHPTVHSYIDAALYDIAAPARTATNATWDPGNLAAILSPLPLAEVLQLRVAVHKVGAATGHTRGVFSVFHKKLNETAIDSPLNVLEFMSAAEDGIFADVGDSGSAVVCRGAGVDDRLVGLLFAVSHDRRRALVVPFEMLQTVFNLELA